MNRTAVLIGIGTALMLLLAGGCSSNSSRAPAPPVQDSGSGPKLVTNLDTLASGDSLDPFGKSKTNIAQVVPELTNPHGAGATEQAMGDVRHLGDDAHPAEARFLNKKAARFDMLSTHVMDQLSSAMRDLEDQEPIVRMKLPTNLRSVILTAYLTPQGKLREIVIEQHSGVAAVDNMVVKACKHALYINNPPADALSGNGDYEMRVDAKLVNFSTVDGEHWNFKTYIGLAVL